MEVHYQKFHPFAHSIEPYNQKSMDFNAIKRERKRRTTKNGELKENKTFFPCLLCGNSYTNSYRYQKHLNELHGVTDNEVVKNENGMEGISNDVVVPEEFIKEQKELRK